MKFDELFRIVNIPVVICNDDEQMTVYYENKSAIRLLNPLEQTERNSEETKTPVRELLRMEESQWQDFYQLMDKNNEIPVFSVEITLYSGEKKYVYLAANKIEADGENYIQICISDHQTIERTEAITFAIETLYNIVYRANTTEEAIEQILAFAGEWTHVSRSYIIESVSETSTSNTYEWCAEGVEPAIEQLKELPKADYSYDELIARGLTVTDDIRKLTKEDIEILSAQGIKALAVIPIMSHEGVLGYVGLDDCEKYRTWTQKEIQFLGTLSELLASLLVRRNTERGLHYSLTVLEVVTNSLDSFITVTDTHTRQILFANNTFALMTGISTESLKGKTITQVFEESQINATYKDPLDEMINPDGSIRRPNYVWEYYNFQNLKWYLVRDSIIKWIDGRSVKIETATEFTNQKEHEAELEYVASMDMMTGAYNREWSRKLLESILAVSESGKNNALVFIDLDRLKKTNDLYGHLAGDKMLLKTIECIKACIRKSDVLCRWGGDEFLIVIRANSEQAELVVKKILNQMKYYNEQEEHVMKLSFSYGIVDIDSKQYKTVEDLVNAADKRMYINKQRLKD